MPEANVLYGVTTVVVLGLVTWVAVVLKTAKEPWARDLPQAAGAAGLRADVPLESAEANDMTSEGDPITAEKVAETEERVEALSDEKKNKESAKSDGDLAAEEAAAADAEAEANEKAKKES